MATEPLNQLVETHLGDFVRQRGLILCADGDQTSSFGAAVTLTSDEFRVTVSRDRGQYSIWVGIPNSQKSHWPLGHLVAFLLGEPDPRGVCDLETECDWLVTFADRVFDRDLLFSKGLSKWATAASRRMFGQT
jgi:hypothetical protein